MELADLPDIERETVAPGELSTDGDNPNTMSDQQYTALKENIREFGFIVPVVVDENYLVADGEHRLRAARELDLDALPVVRLDISDPDRRVLRQVMNKLAGDHDIHDDAEEFQRILDGYDKPDVANLLGRSERGIDGVLSMLDDNDDGASAAVDAASSPSATDGDGGAVSADGGASVERTEADESADLGSPDTVDMDADEFDHECPQCGYEW